MLSRRNTRSTRQLRKSRSSDSSNLHSERPKGLISLDTGAVRQYAFTAAEVAFEREYGTPGRDPSLRSPRSSEESPTKLRRTQSVRFTGPNAVPPCRSSITQRQARAWDDVESRSVTSVLSHRNSTAQSINTSLTALPQATSIENVPSFKAGSLRKARSLFNTRVSRAGHFQSENVPIQEGIRTHGFDMSETTAETPGSFVSSRYGVVLSASPIEEEQEDKEAEAPYGNDPEGPQAQNVRKQASIPAFNRRRHSPKPFKRTVRSNSITSYGDGISSHPAVNPPQSKAGNIGLKVRHISSSVKGKVIRAFRRTSGSSDTVPKQQVDAQKPHFGESDQDPSESFRYPFVPMPEEELVSRCSSRASSTCGLPAPLNPTLHPGSIRTTQSVNTERSQSRVTSWANSTVAEGTQRVNPAEFNRLSIISENGGPHQPSSSAGMVGYGGKNRRVHELFRRPLRPGSGKTNEHVDSQVIYSALQRRLDEIRLEEEERKRLGTPEDGSSRHTSGEMPMNSVRSPSGGSEETCPTTVKLVDESLEHEDANGTTSQHMGTQSSEVTFQGPLVSRRTIRHKRSVACIPEDFETSPQLTNEVQGAMSHKRPMPGNTSAFFPVYQDVQQTDLSPYRKAMLAKVTEEDGRATVYDPSWNVPPSMPTRLGDLAEKNSSGQSVSESNYSRAAGSTPTIARNTGRPLFSHPTNNDSEIGESKLGRGTFANGWTIHRPLMKSDSGSSLADDRVDEGNWVRVSQPAEPSPWTRDERMQHETTQSRHIRESAQLHKDEADDIARGYALTLDQRPQPGHQVTAVPPTWQTTRSPVIETRTSRLPLQERGAPHSYNVQATAPAYLENWSQVTSTSNAENQRASSYQLNRPYTPQPLSQKASIASLASQLRAGLDSSGGDNGDGQASPVRPSTSGGTPTRHSRERVARLRRLQSSNGLRQKPALKANGSPANVHEYFVQGKVTNGPRLGGGSPFARGTMEGRWTPGGSKMVEEFLSNRRERQESEPSSEPAFL